MKITNILSPETVVTDLASAGREEAIRLLVDVLSKARPLDTETTLKDIAARERAGPTLIPTGSRFVAVPHARTSACKQFVMALGLSRQGVPWNGPNRASLVVVILGPPETHALYLRVLSRIARLFETADLLESMLQASSARDVIALLAAAEEPLGEMATGDGMPTFCVLGAGHGGLAMAAHLALTGCRVNLFNRTDARIEFVRARCGIDADGEVNGFASLNVVGSNAAEAMDDCDVLMVVVPATAHRDIARTVAAALGIRGNTAREWLYLAYDAAGKTLHDAMRANPGYSGIRAPGVIEHRYISEDVPMSLVPIASIGTSQLTQANFGQDWAGKPNGGGVPLNSPQEFSAVWRAARPMLVRAYAGTRNISALARMCEETIHIAWHALSLWWFCQTDGRGPNTVRENLQQHVETLKYVAATGKPFEPNVPHHFAFRGADDVTYVVSAVIAARLAKSLGVRHLVLQNMLNTPKCTWGIQDLAKSRAMLVLVRELEDEAFRVILQPRGGLDYFSPDMDKAKAQLAAVTALMDDIEPHNAASPGVIHVVSYCEASHLADPNVVNESVKITRQALQEYRGLRAKGQIDDMSGHLEVAERTEDLLAQARTVLSFIESTIPRPYTPEGLYRIFASGFLPVPYLWECKDEFRQAVQWPTRVICGSVKVVDERGVPVPVMDRMQRTPSTRQGP